MTMLENRTLRKFPRLMGGQFPSGMSFPNTFASLPDYKPQALTQRFSEVHYIDIVRHFQCRRLQRKRTYMRISVRPDTAIPLLRNVKFPNKNALFERLETVPAISLQIQQPLHTKNLQRTRLRILRVNILAAAKTGLPSVASRKGGSTFQRFNALRRAPLARRTGSFRLHL